MDETSIVAIDKSTSRVEAVGHEAKNMLGRTPGNIVAIKPMKDGVIADFDITKSNAETLYQKGPQPKPPRQPSYRDVHPLGDHSGREASGS